MSLISIKEEPDWSVSEAAARADLYVDHKVKNELVLGPVILQRPDMAYKFCGQHKLPIDVKHELLDPTDKNFTTLKDQPVKEELNLVKWETDEQEQRDMQVSDQRIKQELLEPMHEEEFMSNGVHAKEGMQIKQERQNQLLSENTKCYGNNLCEKNNKVLLKKRIVKSNEEDTAKKPRKITKSPRVLNTRSLIKYEEDTDTEYLEERVKQKVRKKKIQKCTYCGKQFAFRSSLTNHIRIHTGQKPFSCAVCSKKFSDYAVLIRHRKVHTGAKPHICDICGNKYSEKYLLKNHKRVHTGEKVYFCKDCPKSFVNSSNFRRHLKVHLHKFTCDMCLKKFKRKSMLVSHIVSHMKPKRYACKFCDKRFGQSGHLYRHMAVHRETKEVYACGVCNREFTQHGSLKKHVTRRVCERRKDMLQKNL